MFTGHGEVAIAYTAQVELLARDAMRGHGLAGDTALSNAIRKASPHKGPWPSVSVWHGGADHTVSPSNGEAVLAQWRGVHGLAADPGYVETLAGHTRRTWRDARGRAVLEHNLVAGMGHGVPLKPDGSAVAGSAAPTCWTSA